MGKISFRRRLGALWLPKRRRRESHFHHAKYVLTGPRTSLRRAWFLLRTIHDAFLFLLVCASFASEFCATVRLLQCCDPGILTFAVLARFGLEPNAFQAAKCFSIGLRDLLLV